MSSIMPAFVRYPEEAAIIGRLLAGYGELEFDLCLCVGHARGDMDMAFKAMFRPRGETQRIDIADPIRHNLLRGWPVGRAAGQLVVRFRRGRPVECRHRRLRRGGRDAIPGTRPANPRTSLIEPGPASHRAPRRRLVISSAPGRSAAGPASRWRPSPRARYRSETWMRSRRP